MAHKTTPVQVWVDVDEGIAAMVRELQAIPGVRTHASCQGTASYRSYVMASWTEDAVRELSPHYDVVPEGEGWGYLHPR